MKLSSLLLATGNAHKTEEIQAMLGAQVLVTDLRELPQIGEIIEDAETFEGNADLKALAVSCYTENLVLADDSGLCVKVLDGEPGVRSARYAGESATMEQNKTLLLKNIKSKNVHGSTPAHFVCALSLAQKGKVIARFRGECHGLLTETASGMGGFGYDPLFIPEGYTETFAEITAEEKNRISHRAHALQQFITWLD